MLNEISNQVEGDWVNAKDEDGRTMLHYAAMRGDVSIISFLLDRNATAICFDTLELKTPLHYACIYGKNIQVIRHLIEYMKQEYSRLNEEKIEQIKVKNAKAIVDIQEGKHGMTSLHLASLAGNVEVLSHLILNEGADLKAKDYSHANLLHHCARNGSADCLKKIFLFLQRDDIISVIGQTIRERIAIDDKDEFGRSPLLYAAFSGSSSLIDLLLHHGADPNSFASLFLSLTLP